mgnify:CR=1 FL=1
MQTYESASTGNNKTGGAAGREPTDAPPTFPPLCCDHQAVSRAALRRNSEECLRHKIFLEKLKLGIRYQPAADSNVSVRSKKNA